ncbi:DUF1360 domain-containing protein [Gordonia sp. HY285]|uniref:DUF1360 domain-containing protein n=1 Tax=Gordonia liuliyuniae TaxID=2911517 RepID=UPI001F1F154C|nr:DUF1360 domain-containing protein [Gordonia liuliyuniae]MCF8610049.1 DUF1360 domain-containing protein [Gordonia liuliyuniae]
MSTLATLLTVGFIIRLTRLLVADQITYKLRARIVVKLGPDNPIAYLVTCSWCLSVWTGAGVGLAAFWWGDTRWWFVMTLAGTASLLTGWAANWLDPADHEDGE